MRSTAYALLTYLGIILSGFDYEPLFSSVGVAVLGLGHGGFFVVRHLECSDHDWLAACQALPPDTFINPGEWDYDPEYGFEVLHLPGRQYAAAG